MRKKLLFSLAALSIVVVVVTVLRTYMGSIGSRKIMAEHSLRVYAYSSFVDAYGPGPILAREFEKQTGVAVDFVDAGDAGLLMSRLKLDPKPVDLVVGLDQLWSMKSQNKVQWRPYKSDQTN